MALPDPSPRARSAITAEVARQTADALAAKHGSGHAERIRLGVEQAARHWWAEDGGAGDFSAFCLANFLADEAALAKCFARVEQVLEQVDGHLFEARRELTTPLDLDTGPLSQVDRLFADVDLAPHVDEDLFRARVAFVALLNFPVHTLGERLAGGAAWDRETWARSRMMDRFAARVPAEVQQQVSLAFTAAEEYVGSYNIRMDRLIDAQGRPLFPPGLRLLSHWGLRDELAAHYAGSDRRAALARQRLIARVMERIVRQEIPAAVVDNPELLWEPESNRVRPAGGGAAAGGDGGDGGDGGEREADRRYAHLLAICRAVRQVDPYSPAAPTYIARKFERERQIPEREVEALLVSVLAAPEAERMARLIERRLGRPLEPFDIWYSGFKSRAAHSEDELDARTRALYPTLERFQAAVPEILEKLGFVPEKARWLAERIMVDPARGAGHALPAIRRQDRAHLRTRLGRDGMDYKGFNVALHEMGHNVEQVFSLNGIDHWWLAGVPNTAFTEAFAFVFQKRDTELLGLALPAEEGRRADALGTLWNTFEIAGVSLVDMRVWHWLYAHPEAAAAELRQAVLAIARDVWNRYFVPLFGAATRDAEILAIYSHMIAYGLYLPDYALGHIIASQVAGRLREGDFAGELERLARQGRLTPDAWMQGAVGGPLSARPLLDEARQALDAAPAGG